MEMKINCLNNLLFSVERSLQGDEVVVMLLEDTRVLPDFFFPSITLCVLSSLFVYSPQIFSNNTMQENICHLGLQ